MLAQSIATPRGILSKLFIVTIFVGVIALALPGGQASAAPNSQFFAPTGHTVRGAFLTAYNRLGGLPIIGYPITDETTENGYTVQYFERERFEYHPENAGTQYEVLLSRLGYELSKPLQPFAPGHPATDAHYFPETQHNVSGEFLRYWNDKGGLSVFGFPISEQFTTNGIITQYFERARFEYHPEVARSTGYAVELGLLGVAYLQQQHHAAAPAPVQLNADEQSLLDNINAARQSAGLGKVTPDAQIEQIAHQRANDMATRNYFSHVNPEGKTFIDIINALNIPYNNIGEIINRNTYPNPAQEAFTSFMKSQLHHDVIMTGAFNYAGAAEATGANGMKYFVVIFLAR